MTATPATYAQLLRQALGIRSSGQDFRGFQFFFFFFLLSGFWGVRPWGLGINDCSFRTFEVRCSGFEGLRGWGLGRGYLKVHGYL